MPMKLKPDLQVVMTLDQYTYE